MTWDYRITRERVTDPDGTTEPFYACREVHYDDGGNVTAWSATPTTFVGDTPGEVCEDLPVEGHPAEFGPNGRVLGPERNARMVALGADECPAFPLPSSRGTRNCIRLAREAGITVTVYEATR